MHSPRPDRIRAVAARRRLPLALVLALALLVAQTLALLHGVAHAPGLASVSAPTGWFADHDADTAKCRLADQLGQHAISLADAGPVLADFSAAPPSRTADAPRTGDDGPAHLPRGPPHRAA